MRLLQFLTKASSPRKTANEARFIIEALTSSLPLGLVESSKGKNFGSVGTYQIRVKPIDESVGIDELKSQIKSFVKSKLAGVLAPQPGKVKVTNMKELDKSDHSSKYQSIVFELSESEHPFEIVIAAGANAGEKFEKHLLDSIDAYLFNGEDKDHTLAAEALEALINVDTAFTKINSVSARAGSTARKGSDKSSGEIIGDIVFDTKKGKKYVSVKNVNGKTVAQFSSGNMVNADFDVNTSSPEWKNFLAPLGIDPEKITMGLSSYVDRDELDYATVEQLNKKISPKSKLIKMFKDMWGTDYYYLRKKKNGFFAAYIDEDFLDSVILKNLRMTEIRYPSSERKSLSISFQSDHTKMRLELRHPQSKRIHPSQFQLSVDNIVF
jgi:hypothetical protein